LAELGSLVLDSDVRLDYDGDEHAEQDQEDEEDEEEEEDRTEDRVGVVHQRHVEVAEQDTEQREPSATGDAIETHRG